MGTINFLSKEQADKLSTLGFKYVEQKINYEQIVYSFIDTPEIRKIVSSQFAKNDFYISNIVCLWECLEIGTLLLFCERRKIIGKYGFKKYKYYCKIL